ncbi:unnamed protein product, partial [Iphiclides podalirius]
MRAKTPDTVSEADAIVSKHPELLQQQVIPKELEQISEAGTGLKTMQSEPDLEVCRHRGIERGTLDPNYFLLISVNV